MADRSAGAGHFTAFRSAAEEVAEGNPTASNAVPAVLNEHGRGEHLAAPTVIHVSANGDRWLLMSDEHGMSFVRHEANLASGGNVEHLDVDAFLARSAGSPESEELKRILRERADRSATTRQPESSTAEDKAGGSHILRTRHEWEICGRERIITLVIETDLELRPGHDGFDPHALEELISAATIQLKASQSAIDRIRIVPAMYPDALP